MQRVLRRPAVVPFLLVLAAILAAGRALGAPGDPFGGDDTGCIPTDTNAARCENAVGKALVRAEACISKCHTARAGGKLADDTAEATCEDACKSKYDRVSGKIDALCPPGYDGAYRDSLYASTQLSSNGGNGAVYPCADTTCTASSCGGSCAPTGECDWDRTSQQCTCAPLPNTCQNACAYDSSCPSSDEVCNDRTCVCIPMDKTPCLHACCYRCNDGTHGSIGSTTTEGGCITAAIGACKGIPSTLKDATCTRCGRGTLTCLFCP